MEKEKLTAQVTDKIGNIAQWGGIETSVLDNGGGRGNRIAWINTGTGLRYKVVIDRAMDIADAFYGPYSLAWLSHGGVISPERFSDVGMNWIRNFGGGLVTTCGLSHVGKPEEDEKGARGLHGRISNSPAEILSITQPDLDTGNLEMSITGIVRETQVFGPSLEMKRTISGTLGEAKIRVRDEVINKGNFSAPHMLLYHINFGWPLVDEGTEILWSGDWHSPTQDSKKKIFRENVDFHLCPPPMKAHSGNGEDVAFIDIEPNEEGIAKCGLYNRKLDLAVALSFDKRQLPWLVNWQHWGKREYVTALEPCTNPPIGQKRAREEETLILLAPDESRSYSFELEILAPEKINTFINLYNKP